MNAIDGFIAAIGIFFGSKQWGWNQGMGLAVISYIGFMVSRTVGLPGIGRIDWWDNISIGSKFIEAAYVLLAAPVVLKMLSLSSMMRKQNHQITIG